MTLKAGPTTIVEAGGVKLQKVTFSLSKLYGKPEKQDKLVRFRGQKLLPLPRAIKEYLSIREAHKESGVSVSKLRALRKSGILQAIKSGKRWLISRESLNQLKSVTKQ